MTEYHWNQAPSSIFHLACSSPGSVPTRDLPDIEQCHAHAHTHIPTKEAWRPAGLEGMLREGLEDSSEMLCSEDRRPWWQRERGGNEHLLVTLSLTDSNVNTHHHNHHQRLTVPFINFSRRETRTLKRAFAFFLLLQLSRPTWEQLGVYASLAKVRSNQLQLFLFTLCSGVG